MALLEVRDVRELGMLKEPTTDVLGRKKVRHRSASIAACGGIYVRTRTRSCSPGPRRQHRGAEAACTIPSLFAVSFSQG